MNEEKQKVLNRVNQLISLRTEELIQELPSVHEIDDGIVIRFFTEWDNCADDDNIKWKKIANDDKPEESVVFFFLPKDSYFELNQRFYIGCMTCLNGKMEVDVNGEITLLEGYTKICVDSEDVKGRVLENTYLITCSDRTIWSETTREHVESNYA